MKLPEKYIPGRRVAFGLSVTLCLLVFFPSACKQETASPDMTSLIDTSYFSDVNAFYFARIAPDGHIEEYSRGTCVNQDPVSLNTLFEGASLSKTVFACMYWKMKRENIPVPETAGTFTCSHDPGEVTYRWYTADELLSHSSGITEENQDSGFYFTPVNLQQGSFYYSDAGYLLLQQAVEQALGSDLQSLAKQHVFQPFGMASSSFIWQYDDSDYVDAFVQGNTKHRDIYRYNQPYANGSLYSTGRDLCRFLVNLRANSALDSMMTPVCSVDGFNALSWGKGIGLENYEGRTMAWQWGSNWSFNSFILIDPGSGYSFVCLTNSISGAGATRHLFHKALGIKLQCFDYIKWY